MKKLTKYFLTMCMIESATLTYVTAEEKVTDSQKLTINSTLLENLTYSSRDKMLNLSKSRDLWTEDSLTFREKEGYVAEVVDCDESAKSVNIPDEIITYHGKYKVTRIGNGAFYNCDNLMNIIISDGVTSIGSSAFESCDSLESIKIPDDVIDIGSEAFKDCTALTSITIPGSVTAIEHYAFSNCTALTSITIPDGVKSIGSGAFFNCESIKRITIPGGITAIGSNAFEDCTALTSITIPGGVTSIGVRAFYNCDSLDSVIISDGVSIIGKSAFYNCDSIKRITIPSSVTSIGKGAFSNCDNLTSIRVNSNNKYYSSYGDALFNKNKTILFKVPENKTKFVIPNSVTSISDGAFLDCESLTRISIPDRVRSIGNQVFEGCSSLKSINILDSVTTIGESAFKDCINIEGIAIPDSVTTIGESAFYNCDSITNIIIPNSLSRVGNWGLGSCDNLTKVIISDGVTSIGSSAFSCCRNLTNIKIPNSVTSIGSSAFSCCRNLTNIKIPNGVTSIGDSAFSSCVNLKTIIIPSSVENIADCKFDDFHHIWIDSMNNVFEGCDNLILKVYRYSYAWRYAEELHIPYKLVTVKSKSVELNKSSLKLSKGNSINLIAIISPSNTTNKTLKWSSSNAKVAKVDSKGKVIAVNGGKATITVKTSNGKTAKCIVTVPYKITYKLNGGKNSKSNPSSYYGKKITLKNPTRKGYTFKGWYSDSKYKKKVTSFSSGNKTLYAKWSKVRN